MEQKTASAPVLSGQAELKGPKEPKSRPEPIRLEHNPLNGLRSGLGPVRS